MFTVDGRRVVVVGAARSGIAAAELLARRGARVTLTETREAFEGMDRLRASRVALELGGHRDQTFAEADLVVVSPACQSSSRCSTARENAAWRLSASSSSHRAGCAGA
jgi:UDP-N-acetylmuramoylalanine--D-glutamate ligase